MAIIDDGQIIELGTPREIQERTLGRSIVEITTDQPMVLEQLPLGGHEYVAGANRTQLTVNPPTPPEPSRIF